MPTTPRTGSSPMQGALADLESKLAAISPWTRKIGATTDDPVQNGFLMAEDIRRGMNQNLLRPTAPDRPAMIPSTDEEVVDLLQKTSTDTASMIDKKLASVVARWRYAVERSEYEAAERLRMLIWTITLYQRGDEGRPEVRSGIEEVSAFIRRNYGLTIPPIPPEYVCGFGNHRLVELVARWDLCSFAVRRGRFAVTRGEEHNEADPGSEQVEWEDVFG